MGALACVGKKDRPIVTAALRTAFDKDTLAASKEHRVKLIEAFEPRHEKLAELMRRAEEDVLACKGLRPFTPRSVHRTARRCADRRSLPRNIGQRSIPRIRSSA